MHVWKIQYKSKYKQKLLDFTKHINKDSNTIINNYHNHQSIKVCETRNKEINMTVFRPLKQLIKPR